MPTSLTPHDATLHARLLDHACTVDDRPIRDAIANVARQLVHMDAEPFDARLHTVTQYYHDAVRSEYLTDKQRYAFQVAADICNEEHAHRAFFNMELPF
jgi:hypothetical protein